MSPRTEALCPRPEEKWSCDDFDESLRRVREGGGEIVKKMAGAGHAVIQDPVGVYMALQARRRFLMRAAAIGGEPTS